MKVRKLLRIHSTRLFPVRLGAHQYKITGIASKCDWVVLSDLKQPHIELRKQRNSQRPETIYLSLRAPIHALNYFVRFVLPSLTHPFILISGSEDFTLPRQIDKRFLDRNTLAHRYVNIILNHQFLRHWTVENLDDNQHPKLRPLPLGMLLEHSKDNEDVIEIPDTANLLSRPLRALSAHRVRAHAQWDTRKRVTKLVKQDWSDWCTSLESEISEDKYLKLQGKYSFVLCVEGGGLDPSPKAWQAILHGAIPIIKKNALSQCYQQLPVIFIDDWNANALSHQKLEQFRSKLSYYYDTEAGRRDTLKRLSLDYWWRYAIRPANRLIKTEAAHSTPPAEQVANGI